MSNTWSVRGVSQDLRRNIVEAANRSGITVAEWLDRAVAPALQDDPPPVDDIVSAIDSCLDRLDALTLPAQARGPEACGPH